MPTVAREAKRRRECRKTKRPDLAIGAPLDFLNYAEASGRRGTEHADTLAPILRSAIGKQAQT